MVKSIFDDVLRVKRIDENTYFKVDTRTYIMFSRKNTSVWMRCAAC